MKARIIRTGEEIELVDSVVYDEKGNEYHLEELFIFGTTIYREPRRYEKVKSIISFHPFDGAVKCGLKNKEYVEDCIMLADALIEELKGGEK